MDTEPPGLVSGDEDKPPEKKYRGIVWQRLNETPDTSSNLALRLLDACVMRALRSKYPDLKERTGILQAKYQDSFKRLFAKDGQMELRASKKGEIYTPLTPVERRRIVYAANCRPVGYHVKKLTEFCRIPLLCPWCFARGRLMPASEWLTGLLPRLGLTHCILYWEQTLSDMAADPTELFFRYDRGLHNTFSAQRYLQVATIGLDPEAGFYWKVSGYALIPNITLDKLIAQTKRRYPQLKVELRDEAKELTAASVHGLLSRTLTVPLGLYFKEGMELFIDLYRNHRDRSKLFRKGGK